MINDNARDAIAISKSDTVKLVKTPMAIYCGGTGDLIVVTEAEWERRDKSLSDTAAFTAATKVTFSTVPAGTIIPVRAVFVGNSSTTTNMVGFLP